MADFTQTPLNPIPVMPPQTPHMSRRVFKWLVILALGLGVASVLMFFFGGSSFTESKVTLTIDGPAQVSVGDEVIYKVKYQNNTKTTLRHLKLSFIYPEGSAIVEAGKIVTTTGNVQSMDQEDLRPGDFVEKEFQAFLVGDRGNIKVARAKLAFDAGNVRSSFEKTAQISTTISDVPVLLTLIGPPTSVSGQSVTYILDYRNQSQDVISGLQLTATYPDGFTPTKITPNASTGTTVWNLPDLNKGDGKRITIQGTLSGREGDSKAVTMVLKRNIDGTYVDYQKTNVTTVISSPLLSVDTRINGSLDYVSHAGDTLEYEISYQNVSNFTLSGLVLTAKLDGAMYDLSTVDPKGGFYDSTARTITWNSTVIPAFNLFAPRAQGTAKFLVKLKSNISGGGSNSLFARATIQLSTENVPDSLNVDRISSTDDVITKITSQPTFRQTMYYNDPAFGSSGPTPPQVGKETVYTIHWQVTNPGNALNNAKIVGTLPLGVTWKNVISVGAGQPQPVYNKNTSQVLWTLGTLPAGVGTSGSSAYELAFQVTVKPSSTQVGQPAPVISNVALSGTDSFTNQAIVVNTLNLTTNSTVDQSGQGAVQ